MNILAIWIFSHDPNMTVSVNGEILEVLELERMFGVKNAEPLTNKVRCIEMAKNYLMERHHIKYFDLLILNPMDMIHLVKDFGLSSNIEVCKFFNADKYLFVDHHHAHAAVSFYQSDFQKTRACTFDGAGNDGRFIIFDCDREKGIKKISDLNLNDYALGNRYSEFGRYCTSIKRNPHDLNPSNFLSLEGFLQYPGKLMGLASYGTPKEEWLPAFKEYYSGTLFDPVNNKYPQLKEACGLPDEYSGQVEADIIATAQRAFELVFEDLAEPFFVGHDRMVLSGGCALNITNNERQRKKRDVFVPPNPHDGGLSLGFMLDYLKPTKPFDSTYMGPRVWDYNQLPEYVNKYNAKELNLKELVTDLINGKIIGVVRGGSEVGPRALGNRSILCHAAIPDMKDILNKKVKNRESYRPFAPLCRLDESSTFFETNSRRNDDHRWMSFSPKVRQEYKEKLKCITHVDGTARLQTVNEYQNHWLYSLFAVFVEMHDYPVLLNTSFNIAGKPILNSYKDAVWMLENTQMDGLILEDYYIKK